MKSIKGSLPLLAVAFILWASAGCESIALVGRPAFEPEGEIVAKVERVDLAKGEVHLITNGGQRTVQYTSRTRVLDRGREHPVNYLVPGDIVAVDVERDAGGNAIAQQIRIREGARERAGVDLPRRPDSKLEVIDGTVENIDSRRGVFDIRPRAGGPVTVFVPFNAPSPEVDRFNSLRNGDTVRIEGQFVSRDRFELESFLNVDAAGRRLR